MESVTDPEMLNDRAFYKLGLFTYDYRKSVVVIGLLACIGMASLAAMGPIGPNLGARRSRIGGGQ